MSTSPIVDRLLRSEEPSIRWKTRVHVLGESGGSRAVRALREEIRRSPRVKALLSRREQLGRPGTARQVYYKWQGPHWVLASLADIGYPAGDRSLLPMRDRVLELWLGPTFFREFEARTEAAAYRGSGVPLIRGRYRRCGSQQGNALYSLITLGIADDRVASLAERLLHWQWPDGGWNCDRHPEADTSSFMETLLPMLGLSAYAEHGGDRAAAKAADRASEVFLRRRLFRRASNGKVIRADFTALHYPLYWHYDFLAGLKAMLRIGKLRDARCADALDLLEERRLPDGGWPAEKRYYTVRPRSMESNADYVDWGGTSRKRMNEWVTVDALAVLRAAGRLRD
ncbi:MAG TPA: hypothetical protein VJP45_09430 [Candidatus Limnocylindria bacterium]|nr:hypothetical protein [Candidatus Limnocylindria bacterium]